MFEFKQFSVDDSGCGMKVSSDSVLLGAWFLPQVSSSATVIDVGAGSGLLSLMAAQVCPQAHITAVEIDAQAAAMCRRNAAASPWAARITTMEADFRTATLPAADAIISNPPYFPEGIQAPDASRAAARHQQTLTYSGLIARAARLLNTGGRLGLIAPAEFEERIVFCASLEGLEAGLIVRVRTAAHKAPKRILCSFSHCGPTLPAETLSLDSSAYRALVKPFYLRIH